MLDLNSKHVVIFEYLNRWNYWKAKAFAIRGWEVVYYRIATGTVSQTLESRIRKWAIPLSYEDCKDWDPLFANDDSRDFTQELIQHLNGSPRLRACFESGFPDIDSIDDRLYLLLYNAVSKDLNNLRKILAYAEGLQTQLSTRAKIRVEIKSSYWRRKILKKTNFLSRSQRFWGGLFWLLALTGAILQASKNGLRDILEIPQRLFGKQQLGDCIWSFAGPDPRKFRLVFFPHQSLNYGQLYKKDYFYEDNPDSPFYPERILHIELEGGQPGGFPEKYWEDQDSALPVLVLPPERPQTPGISRKHWRLSLLSWFQILSNCWRPSLLATVLLLIEEQLTFNSYRNRCRWLESTEVALVGYDILFPPALSIALQSLGIRTVAVQERFLTTFVKYFAITFDTYMPASDACAEYIDQVRNFQIKNQIPVGMVRTDLFKSLNDNGNPASDLRVKVLVLDYHSASAEQFDFNRLGVLNNWKFNLHFYQEIVRLCLEFPAVEFTLRGKNLDWMDVPVLQEIKDRLLLLPNLIVNQDFSDFGIQYRLLEKSHMAIGRHTSLLDEALAGGRPVVILDYYPDTAGYVSKIWDYNGAPVLAHSYKELKSIFLHHLALIKQSKIDADLTQLRETWLGTADGQVRTRIISQLKQMISG